MKAAVWYGKQEVRVEERQLRNLGPDQVKIKVAWTGICGSDLHAYHHGIGVQIDEVHKLSGQKAPLTLGHEFAGVISEVGSNVSGISIGDRVAVEPSYRCGTCEPCRKGMYNVCDHWGFVGLNSDGAFAEYVIVESYMVHKLPDNMTLEEGALVEPTAVAVQGVRQSAIRAGDTVAVFGVGPIGLLTILAARAAGAARVVAVDVSKERLAKAKEIGADVTINSLEENATEKILATFGFVDVAYDCAGVEPTLTSAIAVTKKGGQVMILAIFAEPPKVDLFSCTAKDITLQTSLAYSHIFPQVITMIASGILNVKQIITDRIDLDDIVAAGFEKLITDKSQAKILVKLSGENN